MANSTKIKLLLVLNNVTVTQLAERCQLRLGKKVHREQISQHIHGHRKYPEFGDAIASELGVTVEQLFGNEPIEIVV